MLSWRPNAQHTLNKHMGCFSACCLALMVSRSRQTRKNAKSRAAGHCECLGRVSDQSPWDKSSFGGSFRFRWCQNSAHALLYQNCPSLSDCGLRCLLLTESTALTVQRKWASRDLFISTPFHVTMANQPHGLLGGCGDVPPSRPELTREGVLPWQSCSGSRIKSERNMSLSIS